MDINKRSMLNYIFIFSVFAFTLKFFGIITVSLTLVISCVFLIFGLFSVYLTIDTHQRAELFLGTAIFLTGIVLFVTQHFSIIQPGMLVFPSVLFILGAGFLMLFINNRLNIVFLSASLILIASSILSMFLVRRFTIFDFPNRIAAGISDYYPVFIILSGVYYLLKRRPH
ncbi:MAG: hypothetical protein WCJ01_07155 [Ignavibacteria bacterium]